MTVLVKRGKKTYKVIFGGRSCKGCSFSRQDAPDGNCVRNCYLPKWWGDIVNTIGGAHLREVKG